MKKILSIIVVMLGLIMIPALASAAIPAAERAALMDLYTSTTGSGWTNSTNWNGAAGTECTWYGVTCDAGETHVTRLMLYSNNLTGTIPASIGNLVAVTHLLLYSNKITGSIPVELGSLTNISNLLLPDNQLTGIIPAELGNMTSIQILDFSINQLSGSIPAELGNLSNLQNLYLCNNQLSGAIPAQLGNLTNLQQLVLFGNQLSGPIPLQLINLTSLTDGVSEFRWNALYTTDAALKTFLDSKQYTHDWVSTQTIAPSNLTVTGKTTTSITLNWTAIPYTADGGGYEIYYSSTSGGSYALFETTANKSVTGSTVTGLESGNTYYFKIRTKTNAHTDNPNIVYSEYTTEVFSQTGAPDIAVADSIAPIGDYMMPFGNVTEGNTSDQTVTVTNSGNVNLIMGTIASANQLAAPFGISADNCSNQTVAPTGTCTVTIRFAPSTVGSFSDTFDIPSNDPDTATITMSVAGTGTAVPVPDIVVSDSIVPDSDLQMPFDDVTEGATSPEQSVVIANAGTADLVVSNIQLSGAEADQFSINVNGGATPCGGTAPIIAAGGNCTITVTLSPTSTGAKNATIVISSNDPDEGTVNVSLSGTGLSSVQNNPPSAPTLVFPANGQSGLGTTVKFRWKKSADPDGDTVSYHLSYCTDQNFNGCTPVDIASSGTNKIYFAGLGIYGGVMIFGIVFTGTRRGRNGMLLLIVIVLLGSGALLAACGSGGGGGVFLPLPQSGSTDMTYSASGLTAGTTYYWKVVADDGKGGLGESTVWNFTTQ